METSVYLSTSQACCIITKVYFMTKSIFTFSFLLLSLFSIAQTNDRENIILKVENSLAPDIVYGDTLSKMNILQQMAAYKINGLSIAVIKNYKIDWAKGYGWADVQEKRPVTTGTRFQAASISKSISSLALLKLVQQGKIDLYADINNSLKTWKFPYDSLSGNKKISLANLLSHSAGLSVHGFAGYSTADSIPNIVAVLNGKRPANSPPVRSLFEPSKKFQYSGGGTTISQLILTDITGMRYEDYLKKEVLQPIGMTNSFYNQPPPAGTQDLATAYNGATEVKGKYHVYPEQAAAGLWTTPTDLSKYVIETQLEYEGKSNKVLSQQMMRKRLTPYIDSTVGLGVFIINKSGEKYFNHNGGNEGFLSTYYGSLEGGNGVVIMINADNFNIIPELVNSVAIVYGWKNFYTPVIKKVNNIPRDTLLTWAGNYLLVKDTLSLILIGDQLRIKQNNQPADGLRMIPAGNKEFFIKEIPGITISVLYNKEGKADALEINEGGTKTKAGKIN
jgi:CubicO group peptidase (beta-lactamase class C family)